MFVKMGFKGAVEKIKMTLLCCRKVERKHSLDIGSPTDVRRMDITEGMPNLTEADAKFVREKASNDAIRLLSLPSPTSIRSREPSHPLLTAASTNLPSFIPTPPRQKHADTSPPAFRMKTMWERTRRLSNTLSHRSSAGYHELDRSIGEDGLVMLDLDLDLKDDNKSPLSIEGFEMQDTIGGTPSKGDKGVLGKPLVAHAVNSTDLGDSSDSDAEGKPLVRA